MIGCHGNGLTHLLWMHPGGLVVELIGNTFQVDYQALAESAVCGVSHTKSTAVS
jgi:hypothetical protein